MVRTEWFRVNGIYTFSFVPLHKGGLNDRHNLVDFLGLEESNHVLHVCTVEAEGRGNSRQPSTHIVTKHRRWRRCEMVAVSVSPVSQIVVHCFVKMDFEMEVHVTFSVGGQVDLAPDIRHPGHLESGHEVETSLYWLAATELATLGVGHLGPAAV